jgi:hypothetical protein
MLGTQNCTAAVSSPPPCQYSTQFALAAIFLTAIHRSSMAVGLGLLKLLADVTKCAHTQLPVAGAPAHTFAPRDNGLAVTPSKAC